MTNLIVMFIGSMYATLHTVSGFSENLSLALVTQLLFHVFTDMSNLRDGV
jgi:hypothetical protein